MKRRLTKAQLSDRSGGEADEGRACLWLMNCYMPAKDLVDTRFCRRPRALCLDILCLSAYSTPRFSKCDHLTT
jgi:hypothetical protein